MGRTIGRNVSHRASSTASSRNRAALSHYSKESFDVHTVHYCCGDHHLGTTWALLRIVRQRILLLRLTINIRTNDGINYDGTNDGTNYDGTIYDGTNYDGTNDGTNYDGTNGGGDRLSDQRWYRAHQI